jgi:hypothetical protein
MHIMKVMYILRSEGLPCCLELLIDCYGQVCPVGYQKYAYFENRVAGGKDEKIDGGCRWDASYDLESTIQPLKVC